MHQQIFELPGNLAALGNGEYHGNNCLLTIDGKMAFVWLIKPAVPMKREFSFIAKGVPGILPVSCCATPWSPEGPFFGDQKVYLRAIERGRDVFRAAVEHHDFTALTIAVGLTFFRPTM